VHVQLCIRRSQSKGNFAGVIPQKNIDGVKMLLHEGGCGGTRQDANTLCFPVGWIYSQSECGGCHDFKSWVPKWRKVKTLQEKLKAVDPNGHKACNHPRQQQLERSKIY